MAVGHFSWAIRPSSECVVTALIYIPPTLVSLFSLHPSQQGYLFCIVFCLCFYIALAGLELAV